ncbi:phage tail protein [Meridianimarinicoccus sp. RP-17]|uniref:phage tail protein n=1 Tax=Meridianimarinicoccus zhengii TaxID=2056810 RepID=UPI000DADC123|nr:phage tail protein [Phycocomes zhengii]
MAVLAVAGAGALGSTALGLGWQAGWLLGSVVGQALFAPGRSAAPDQEGPRLSDLAVSSSAYGAPIPIGYGTLRMGGNMIWSSGLVEDSTTRRVGRSGKGGGGRGGTVTEYSYAASFALAFGEGPADAVLRIWADGKLIYDRTGLSGAGTQVARPGYRMRFHPGTEDQLPDPLIEATQGAGNVPAHRGLVLLVFEDFALGDYGNRIPNITAEIAWRAQPQYPVEPLQRAAGPVSGFLGTELAVDWRRGRGFLAAGSGGGLRRFNARSMVEDRQVVQQDVLASDSGVNGTGFDCLFCGTDGALYCTAGSGNALPILRIDPDALRETGRFGSYSSALSKSPTRFAITTRMAMIEQYGARYLLTANGLGPSHLGLLSTWDMGHVWHENDIGMRIAALTGGVEGEGWALTGSTGLAQLHRISVSPSYSGIPGDVTRRVAAEITPQDIDPAATGFAGGIFNLNVGDFGGLNFDPTDGGLVFWCGVDGADFSSRQYVVKWRPGLGILWRTAVPIWPSGFANRQAVTTARLTGDGFAMARETSAGGGTWRVIRLDLRSGAITSDASGWMNGAAGLGGAQVYDGVTDSMLAYDPAGGFSRLLLGRIGGVAAPLGTIVTDLCARAGLAPDDIGVGELTDAVPGFVLARQGSVRGAIEPLARACFFDGVESDDRLVFRKRGRPSTRSLDPTLLIPLRDGGGGGGSGGSGMNDVGETWRERRAQEVELPARVSVIHMDAGADYQQGAQSEQRAAPTMASRHQVTVELPIAMGPATARSIAARALYAAWTERSGYEARLPSDYLALEPTDVVDLTLPSGSTFRARIERVDLGADFTLSIQAVSQEPASYDISREADGGQGRPTASLDGAPETQAYLPDLPLLRDVDAPAGALSRLHAFMGGYGTDTWPGAALFRSSDRVNWGFVTRSRTEVAHGVTQTALAAPRAVFATDDENTLQVAMTTGGDRLESVTQAALLDGANAALVLGPDGTPEILQFREVEPLGGDAYRLRGFLRGRRGTDVFATGHPAGAAFLLLEPDTIATSLLPLGDLGQPRHWRAVGSSERFEDAPILTRTHTGRDLMPYAPVHLRAVTVADGIALSWVRRTRLGGDLRDDTGTVPLAEAAEAYELDILDGPGGTVLRTLTSDIPSVLYPSAQIAADFGSAPATLSVSLCQISEAVGRGLPRTTTLEITP